MDTSSVYKDGVEKVWLSVHAHLYQSVTTEKLEASMSMGKDELEKKLRIQYKLVSTLKNPPDHHQKKQAHVSFPAWNEPSVNLNLIVLYHFADEIWWHSSK